ncbi:acyl-CoA synthetase (AMP-forming)/AMP-acid ligase II [Actinoplanes lutulentus]|uniref:Acyl-CoA synthetase (AMP-forming)/AMP-acid ligase II n=1 Tax=Actinoplanes lutulentus TaxID=1287878 RepID=A0A327ZKX1_9ACTN|nr:FadD3 family acyl-CoA ligase [Actinoplanes lutulentus]MBB2941133.1 acyl-CoA synthetase (AMP-forming)/AMP-acid ligase II [Actinoplanes lutulentus]RAK43442.1 acyl-CoA synthetase (AMP-forming)/AMP-acid ligase II [Actinoplanes lutulentus]
MEQTIPAAVIRAAREFGPAPALVDPAAGRWTFAELRDEVVAAARAFIASGIEPGDRVAIWAPNTAHWVFAALGASCAGATLVPINTRYTAVEAADVLTRSGAKALIVSGPFLGRDRSAELSPPDLTLTVTLSDEGWASFLRRGLSAPVALAESRAAGVRTDDLSDILFTSGTTGRSKGAMSAHRQALAVAASWAETAGLRADDNYLVINPFFHSFGLKAGILACLLTGATIVPQVVFDVGQACELIAAERITVLPGAPTLYIGLLDHPEREKWDLSSLRLAVTGAATVPPALVARIRTALGIGTVLTAYGLTEAVVATMCRPGDDDETVATTCGRAAAGMEVRIADNGGEVLLQGPNVMLGYLDDPEATAAAIDAEGWLHTGDAGSLDERGYLTITDRLKDMYICGGFNVYPAEVERALAAMPGIAEAAVVGVADERLGEVGRAFVVPRNGVDLDPGEVIGFCRGRLAGFKVPRRVEVRESLPHNASGKVLKYLLRSES